MNVLVPGGCGYIGSALVPLLLHAGHRVTVFDAMFFGRGGLSEHKDLTVTHGDVRNRDAFAVACEGQEAVIYLASISSDAMCRKDPDLARAVNQDSFGPAVLAARNAGARRFIYASSVAAYGSSDTDVTEDRQLSPTTLYGEAKAACESMAMGFNGKDFSCTVTRSASVCGPAPRMRFDITVNKMAHDAIRRGRVIVNGGGQKRCHVHIADICSFYSLLLDLPRERTARQVFNVVAENQTVLATAELVCRTVAANRRRAVNMPFVEVRDATDDRSYSVDGTKAREMLGFRPKWDVTNAVIGMRLAFDHDAWKDSEVNLAYQNMVPGYA